MALFQFFPQAPELSENLSPRCIVVVFFFHRNVPPRMLFAGARSRQAGGGLCIFWAQIYDNLFCGGLTNFFLLSRNGGSSRHCFQRERGGGFVSGHGATDKRGSAPSHILTHINHIAVRNFLKGNHHFVCSVTQGRSRASALKSTKT